MEDIGSRKSSADFGGRPPLFSALIASLLSTVFRDASRIAIRTRFPIFRSDLIFPPALSRIL